MHPFTDEWNLIRPNPWFKMQTIASKDRPTASPKAHTHCVLATESNLSYHKKDTTLLAMDPCYGS